LGRIADRYYVYDAAITSDVIVRIPTLEINPTTHGVFVRIQHELPDGRGRTLDAIRGLFRTRRERAIVDNLVERGFLEPLAAPRPKSGRPEHRPEHDGAFFRDKQSQHYFRRASFFNLPAQADHRGVVVGLWGVPVSSVSFTLGAQSGPQDLRALTQGAATWFDIHENGAYHEAAIQGELPEILGWGVVVKDFGDISPGTGTVGSFFDAVDAKVAEALALGIKPVFFGGDHSITFPIVHAFRQRRPDIGVLHLDAHNDLFFSEETRFDHSAPIHGLWHYSRAEPILSFGLRTHLDLRVRNVDRVAGDPRARERLGLFSLEAARRFAAEPSLLRKALARFRSRPFYLTIDLDVLSSDAIDHQVTTPAGQGLEWHDLYRLVKTFFESLNILGCDVVEFNRGGRAEHDRDRNLVALIVLLIDRLAKPDPGGAAGGGSPAMRRRAGRSTRR
jgi:agmatinase